MKKPQAIRKSALSKASRKQESFWHSKFVPKHRRGITDMEWASLQSSSQPHYVIGDVVEFKDGGFGIINKVDGPHDGWPSTYSTATIEGMPRGRKNAWHYEGDFKRLVAESPLRALTKPFKRRTSLPANATKEWHCRGPRLPDECRKCEFYNLEAEEYACCACETTIKRDNAAEPNRDAT